MHPFVSDFLHRVTDWAASQPSISLVQSLRVYYRESFEVEFGITSRAWAALPIDPGTQHVVGHGIRLLMDREGLLGRLLVAITAS